MTILTHQDRRDEVERLAHLARTFPGISVDEDLAGLAPHLTPAERDAAFGDLVDGITLRRAAARACNTAVACAPEVLAKRIVPAVAARATGTLYPELMAAASTVAAVAARNWDVIDGLDASVDGARRELDDIRTGNATAVDYPDADPELIEQLAEEKLTAAVANLAFVAEHRLERLLVDFTVAAWRFTDGARMRLTGQTGGTVTTAARAARDALTAAGVELDSTWRQGYAPAEIHIYTTRTGLDGDRAVITWTAGQGWATGWFANTMGGGRIHGTRRLGLGLRDTAGDVAAAAVRWLGGAA